MTYYSEGVKIQGREIILKAPQEKCQFKGRNIRIIPDPH